VGPVILGIGWTLASLSIIAVTGRFYVRGWILHRLHLDDWIMLLSLVLGIINTAFVSVAIHYGLGRHIDFIDPPLAMQAIKWDYWAQPTAIMSPAFGRISFALLLLSVSGTKKTRRWMLYGIMVTQFVINALTFILILVQCQPIELLWDKTVDGHCWDLRVQEYTGYFQGSFNSLTDLILAIFPALVVWHLNMKLAMKLSLIALMGLGIFAMVASIVKTVLLRSVGSSTDYTYNTSLLIVWWTIELYLVIIGASIPTLKPLVSKRDGSTQGSSKRATYGMNTFQSHRQAGFRGTHTPGGDHFMSSSGLSGRSSQEKVLGGYSTEHPADIRRTVNISVQSQRGYSPRPEF